VTLLDDRPTGVPPALLKLGGELLEDPGHVRALSAVVAQVSRTVPLVIVHGGGREIDAALARAGIQKRQVDGLRITDEPTLDVVVSTLGGLINTRLVAALSAAGVPAVGLTGADAALGPVRAAAKHLSTSGQSVDLGRVGEPVGTGRPRLLDDLCARGYVPTVASLGAASDGQLFNVNADTLAAHLAARLHAPRLVIAGGTAGVLGSRGDTIPTLSLAELDAFVASGGATAGMVAKLHACREAIQNGVREVFVADGRDLHSLAAILLGDSRARGRSTRILAEGAGPEPPSVRQSAPPRSTLQGADR
jgi:acetylglutamate kinase